MKVTGSYDVSASPERVWAALTDPAVLARTLPGALSLERVGDDEYRVTIEAGIASIKGVYSGTVALADQRPPEAYTLRASGSGGPGTIDATAAVTLIPTDSDHTRVVYNADAVVGGTIAGVGQRVLAGVAKRTAAQFFSAVEDELTLPPSAKTSEYFTYEGRGQASAVSGDLRTFLAGVMVGAVVALLGVLVGRRTAT